MGRSEARFLQELALYAASAALSCLVLVVGLRNLDPNRAASKKAAEQKREIAKRLGRPFIQTNPYEDTIACDVINPDHIDVEFDSIGGLERVKEALYELVILPLQRPELFSHGKLLTPQKGVLLYGPPGTGKTMLAKAIAKESGAVFINVRICNLMSKWFGDAQKLENARVLVLAATNRPSELDEAILRRLPQAFEIGIPDRSERAKILKVILKGENVEENIDYEYLASLYDGYTGSDLLDVCKQAAYIPIRDFLRSEKNGQQFQPLRALKQSDLESAFSMSRKTKVATAAYGLNSQLPEWSGSGDQDDYRVTFSEIARFLSRITSNLPPEARNS